MGLNGKISAALTKMDFVHKYEELSNKYNDERTPIEAALRKIDRDVVMKIIRRLGIGESSPFHVNSREVANAGTEMEQNWYKKAFLRH